MRGIERIKKFLNSDGMIAVYVIFLIGVLLIASNIIEVDWDTMTWFRFSAGAAFVIILILIIIANGSNRRDEILC